MRLLALLLFSCIAVSAWTQIYTPVKWTTELKDNGDGTYSFIANAKIDEGYWVYSEYLENEDGPIATTVNFDKSDHFKLIGKATESDNAKKVFDKTFEMEVVKFMHTYTITQKLKIIDPSQPITGYINYMTCNNDRCLPPVDVDFNLKPVKGSSGDAKPKMNPTDERNEPAVTSKKTEVVNAVVEKVN